MALEFTAEERATIDGIVARYPNKAAALLPVLHMAQDKFQALSIEAQLLVAHTLDVPPTRVREVVTFYEMFHEHPEGQFHLELCTNIACHLGGADLLMKHLVDRLGIEIGHQTEDGTFSLMEVECLASCGSGPMMKVGMDYYEHLDEASIDTLLDKLKALAPSLGGKAYICGKDGPHTGPVPGHNPALPVIPPKAEAKTLPPKTTPEDPPAAAPAEVVPAAPPQAQAKKVEAATAEAAKAEPKDGGEAGRAVEAPKAEPEKKHDEAATAKDESATSGKALPSFEAPRGKAEDKAGK